MSRAWRLHLTHAYVPDGFDAGIWVFLIKDKTGSITDIDNYTNTNTNNYINVRSKADK